MQLLTPEFKDFFTGEGDPTKQEILSRAYSKIGRIPLLGNAGWIDSRTAFYTDASGQQCWATAIHSILEGGFINRALVIGYSQKPEQDFKFTPEWNGYYQININGKTVGYNDPSIGFDQMGFLRAVDATLDFINEQDPFVRTQSLGPIATVSG